MQRGAVCLLLLSALSASAAEMGRRAVPREHPYLLGPRDELRALAKQRPPEYERMVRVARGESTDARTWIISAGLVAAIEEDAGLAKAVHQVVMKVVNGPIRVGHVTFGSDLAYCGFAYDLCHDAWSAEDRARFHDYVNKTVDANVKSETSVFHNAWYSYKNWGIGIASYATYHDNPRAKEHLRVLEQDYRTRAAPAFDTAGDGGGWAEGYYIHYWQYKWLLFCEIARRVEGIDYYALAPKFYRERAVAAMFETYPGSSQYNSRRSIPMGDSGGRTYGGDRDEDLAARRILVNYFRDDPSAQAVHVFNEITPRVGTGNNAYKDFLWRDRAVPRVDLTAFRLSHYSPGPGFVYARSSWDDDATYFFFKAGDRFTAHQHLDVGTFLIFKHAELVGDGGHYTDFGGDHDVNYHLRTIAHSTMLVHDPQEKWPAIRAGKVTSNDGGQHHDWRHHNGAASDLQDWQKQKNQFDIADMLAFEDRGGYVYAAADATRAYSPNKLEHFTRQIVYLRPDTFVIFDRVKSRDLSFRKTWLLQAMNVPTRTDVGLAIENGKGRLSVQTLLPEQPEVRLVSGADLYTVGGNRYPPSRDTGPAPKCRVEVSPSRAATQDYFLHVLTTGSRGDPAAPEAELVRRDGRVMVKVAGAEVVFQTDIVSAQVTPAAR